MQSSIVEKVYIYSNLLMFSKGASLKMTELEDGANLDSEELGDEKLDELDEIKLIAPHKPDLREKLFFLLSGFVISVPLTLYIGLFTDNLCTVLPRLYAELCAVSISSWIGIRNI